MAPWADVLFAMDRAWWVHHHPINFSGERISTSRNCPGARNLKFVAGGNSGAGAISLAEYHGVQRIILLGYDCQFTGGKRHWHGNHPRALKNAGSLPDWPAQFSELAERFASIEIINATRSTALTQWPRMSLEKALTP